VHKAFRYRLYPTRIHETAMEAMLDTHRHLYNRALAERKDAYETEQRTVRYGEQSARLKDDRTTNPSLTKTNFSSCQATLRRLDKALTAFFRRLKAGEKPGYPRFRGPGRYNTVEFPSYGDGCKLDGSRVYFQHIGTVKVKLHRPTLGIIKTVSFTHEAGHWYVVFSCDLGDVQVTPSANPSTGIDLGLKAFVVTADGQQVNPPQYYRKAQKALRVAQRIVARRQKGGNRRHKAVRRLARRHQHIANQRRDFHHKTAHRLIQQYGSIAHEDLHVRGIARTRLAKSTHDAGWTQFLTILHSKAEEAGVTVIAVSPHNTTQMCSGCGALPTTPKTLKDRVHTCSCGLVLDRDVNAARNILAKAARTEPSGVNVAGVPACVA